MPLMPQNIPTPQIIMPIEPSMAPYTRCLKVIPGTAFEACRAICINSPRTVTIVTVDDQDNPVSNFYLNQGQIYKISAVQVRDYTGFTAFALY